MSTEPSREDLRACGTLLNTLHAEHQGAFVHASVLAKLGHGSFEEGLVGELQGRIKSISGWAQGLWDREPILSADGSSRDDAALDAALELLDDLALRMERVGRELETALDAVRDHEHDGKGCPEASLVAAGFAWVSYAHENELRGVLHHAETLDDQELGEPALHQLPVAQEGLRVLHHLLDRLEEPGPPGCDLLAELHRSTAHLPGLYGAKANAVRGLAAEIRELRA